MIFRQIATIAGAALLAAGCGSPPGRSAPEPKAAVVTTEAPRCETARHCERMWLEAQEALQLVTGMRLRIVTADRLETYAPTRYGRLGGTVQKYPVGADAYEMRVRLFCYTRASGCAEEQAHGTNLFNLQVSGLARPPR